ncbi:DegV family protein [Catenulispora sp. NL8]|uniref:DegV family protein n=1 Tax=Catenulispora pinistramenti TaxID=2705254 RepID=A0ABS5L3S9_9ACTN|nr:DegV family protein [Catenulispora pinistramenti]MBS2553008.1 DegV family protein [Catenulispora pinistramenti]
MPRIALVTDSTACLSAASAAAHGVTAVPLEVIVRGAPHSEADPATGGLLVAALRAHETATTSRPTPEDFAAAYRAAAEGGAEGVVSLHISAELSATLESAELAAKDAPIPVRVLDSRTIGMALGFSVLAAAEAGRDGEHDLDAVADIAAKRSATASAFFYVDTLEYLRRGGRIGSARALLGSALAMKPLLHMADGRVEPLEKVRTSAKAIARLEEIAVERAGGDGSSVEIAVQHLDAAERAEALAARLQERLPGLAGVTVCEVGAVIGAHVGPGVLGVIVAPG